MRMLPLPAAALLLYCALLVGGASLLDRPGFFWLLAGCSVACFLLVSPRFRESRLPSLLCGLLVALSYLVSTELYARRSVHLGVVALSPLLQVLRERFTRVVFSQDGILLFVLSLGAALVAAAVMRKRVADPLFLLGCLYWASVFTMPLALVYSLCFRHFSLSTSATSDARIWGFLTWVAEPIAYHLAVLALVLVGLLLIAAKQKTSVPGQTIPTIR